MYTDNLVFGRENIAYAVLATYSNAVNERPVVVSMHLGEKLAQAHLAEMQKRSNNVHFFVGKIKIKGEIELLEALAPNPDIMKKRTTPTRRIVRIVPKKS